MFNIDQNIKKSETLPAEFYGNKDNFLEYTDKLFSSSWQFIGDEGLFKNDFNLAPINYLEGFRAIGDFAL